MWTICFITVTPWCLSPYWNIPIHKVNTHTHQQGLKESHSFTLWAPSLLSLFAFHCLSCTFFLQSLQEHMSCFHLIRIISSQIDKAVSIWWCFHSFLADCPGTKLHHLYTSQLWSPHPLKPSKVIGAKVYLICIEHYHCAVTNPSLCVISC